MSNDRTNMDQHELAPTAPGEGTNAAAAAAALEASEAEIAKLRTDLQDASDRVLRAQAELDNYRKRVRREIEDERRYAAMPLLRDLLPVLDNINRAIAASAEGNGDEGLREGVRLIAQHLEQALARHDCKRIEALHQPFDPAYHEAISQQPTAEYEPGTVVLVAQEGFTLHDRVVRPAQVIVSSRPQ